MRKWLLAAFATGALQAAVIRGVVVEHQSGKPLARTLIVAQPVTGTPGGALSVRSNSYGAFEFPPVAGGAYLLSASRRSFAPVQYGQKRWKGSGMPVVLEELASTALVIRMQRFGSIAGAVLDENDVGLPEHDVAVYRNTRPPQMMAKDKTDDRGMYRIWGLEPGAYLVRTLGKQYEEAGYLPTFSRETARADQARHLEVQLDEQVTEVNVRPLPGQLFTVAGRAVSSTFGTVTLVLTSDTGTETTVSENDGTFKFRPMPPGAYELTATIQPDRRITAMQAGWMPLVVDRDRTDWRINLTSMPDLRITVDDTKGNLVDLQSVSIVARRKDPSGEGRPETLRPTQGRVSLLPGRWDLALTPAPAYYVAGFTGPRSEPSAARADGWNELVLQGAIPVPVKFTLSANPGSVRGEVAAAGKAVAGAPIFLEAYDAESRRRLVETVRITRSDTRGQYRFNGLAPGTYRILSTFEFQTPDPAAMDAANPKFVKVEEARDAVVQLDLYAVQ